MQTTAKDKAPTSAGWLRLDALREFMQFAEGRIERAPFPMGGWIYFVTDNGKRLYCGNDFAAAKAALPKARS